MAETPPVNKREMARKANDRIRVANPTAEDFIVYWDSNGFLVPNKNKDTGAGLGQTVILRYIAVNYVTHMTDKILSARLKDLVGQENQRRVDKGHKTMTKFPGDDSEESFSLSFRIDNPNLRQEIMKLLWLGIEEEYGMDTISLDTQAKPKDLRGDDEAFLDSLDRPAPPTEIATTTNNELSAKKTKLAEKAGVDETS